MPIHQLGPRRPRISTWSNICTFGIRMAEIPCLPRYAFDFFGIDVCGCTHLLADHRYTIFSCAISHSNGHLSRQHCFCIRDVDPELRRQDMQVSRSPPWLTVEADASSNSLYQLLEILNAGSSPVVDLLQLIKPCSHSMQEP